MNNSVKNGILIGCFCGASWFTSVALATEFNEPSDQFSQFSGFSPDSSYTLNYDDINALMKNIVVDLGMSTRESAPAPRAPIGTRIKRLVKTKTLYEGNRLYYEAFHNNAENRQLLRDIRTSLENVPSELALHHFSKDEQLAYWLNLYTITLIDEIVAIYPKAKLADDLYGEDSILDKKVLEVAGVSLSLNNIKFDILGKNFGHDPLLLYGFYQGVVGGPSIRKQAYTAKTVYQDLKDNAKEFINSNRGTYIGNNGRMRVSSFYQQHSAYFDDFESDLNAHLLEFIEGEQRSALLSATEIVADISDWAVTDIYGSYRSIGGAYSTQSTDALADFGIDISQIYYNRRYDPEFFEFINTITYKAAVVAAENGQVTISDIASDTKPVESNN